MPSLTPVMSIKQYQEFIHMVYGIPNDRHFSLWDMQSNVERFTMRGLKGIRKKDPEKIKKNLLISLSWFLSIMNRLHISLEEEIWNRFPSVCSYCASSPCHCKEIKIDSRQKIFVDSAKRPKTLTEFQAMFNNIYPPEKRTLDHAGVHLAEEIGEFSETILAYRGEHNEERFKDVREEAADVFSCIVGVFNSLQLSMAEELSALFSNNCHTCHQSPCSCSFSSIVSFKS